MMATSLTLSMLEIILLFFVAISLGITIHFFITSRKRLKATTTEMNKNNLVKNEWKLKYLNDMEVKDREVAEIRQQLKDAEENANIYSIEAEELRQQNDKFEDIIVKLEKKVENMERLAEETPVPPPVTFEPIQTP